MLKGLLVMIEKANNKMQSKQQITSIMKEK